MTSLGISGELMGMIDPYDRIILYISAMEKLHDEGLSNDIREISFNDADIWMMCNGDMAIYERVMKLLLEKHPNVFSPSEGNPSVIIKTGLILKNRELEHKRYEYRKYVESNKNGRKRGWK